MKECQPTRGKQGFARIPARWRRHPLRLLAALAVGAVLGLLYARLFLPQTYAAEVRFYCIGSGTAPSGTEDGRSAAAQYAGLLGSDLFAGQTAESLGGSLTAEDIRSVLQITADRETSAVSVRAVSADARLAESIGRRIQELAPSFIAEMTEGGALKDLGYREPTAQPVGIPYLHSALIGGAILLLLAAVTAAIRGAADRTVPDARCLQQMLGLPVLGQVPEFESVSVRHKSTYGCGRKR